MMPENGSVCTFNVTVNDTEPPEILCSTDIEMEIAPMQNSTVINYSTPLYSDNCPGVVLELIQGLPSGSAFPVGTTTNIFQVTDSSDNKVTCSFNVIITQQDVLQIVGLSDIIQDNDFRAMWCNH